MSRSEIEREDITIERLDTGIILRTEEIRREFFFTLEDAKKAIDARATREELKWLVTALSCGPPIAVGIVLTCAGVKENDPQLMAIGTQLTIIGGLVLKVAYDKFSRPSKLALRQLKKINSALEESENRKEKVV
jgi:hypothetical protein